MSDTNTRNGPMPVISSCDGRTADVTSNVRSAATGGMAAPDPSSSSRSGRSAAASSAAASTLRVVCRPRQAAPAPASAHRGHSGQHGVLEVVRSGVLAGACPKQQLVSAQRRARRIDRRGLGRAAPPHRDHDHPSARRRPPDARYAPRLRSFRCACRSRSPPSPPHRPASGWAAGNRSRGRGRRGPRRARG